MARLNSVRKIDGSTFVLVEKIHDYRTAATAQAEYWAEGYCCRKEPVQEEKVYNLWVGPERKRQVRTLEHEDIKRRKLRAVR